MCIHREVFKSLKCAVPYNPRPGSVLDLRGFLRYIEKTYHWFDVLRTLSDSRAANKSTLLEDIVSTLFMIAVTEAKSFNSVFNSPLSGVPSLQHMQLSARSGKKTFGRDAAVNVLSRLDLDELEDLNWGIMKKAAANKAFDGGLVAGKKVGIIDGIETWSSSVKKKDCPYCQTRKLKNGTIEAFHRAVVLSLAMGTYCLVMAFTMLTNRDPDEKAEGELTGAKRILEKLSARMPGFLDLIIGDALYANAPMINAILDAGANAVVRIKGDDRKLIRNAEEHFGKGKGSRETFLGELRRGGRWLVIAASDSFSMPGVEQPVKLVRFTEIPILENGAPDRRIGKDGRLLREERTVYMISTDPELSAVDIWKLSHYRWDIENSVFHTLSTECHVKHMFTHAGAVAMLWFIVFAFNLRMLYLYRFRARDFLGRRLRQDDFVERLRRDLHAYSIRELLKKPPSEATRAG